MNFDIIPPAPLHARVRNTFTKVLFWLVWIVVGGFMYIGVKEVFGPKGILYAIFAVAIGYGSFYIATKVAEGFEQNQIKKTEVWDSYWRAYEERVESLEKAIRDFPEDGREYDLKSLKSELKYMQAIEARYYATHK